jgi:dihydroorotate dehydrogenase (NAD+) catalytic subunit
MAGAVAVQVGTASFANPLAALEVLEGIERYCREHDVSSISELVGAARAEPVMRREASSL